MFRCFFLLSEFVGLAAIGFTIAARLRLVLLVQQSMGKAVTAAAVYSTMCCRALYMLLHILILIYASCDGNSAHWLP